MAWWATLLMGGAGVLISLVITFAFNGVINWPKQKKKQQEADEKAAAEKHQELLDHIEITSESIRQSLSEEIQSLQNRDEQFEQDLTALKSGLQVTVKNDLKLRYEKWIGLGYAPIDAKDDLEKMYQVYHSLGANGVMDSMRAEFLALPLERVIRKQQANKNKKTDDSDSSEITKKGE